MRANVERLALNKFSNLIYLIFSVLFVHPVFIQKPKRIGVHIWARFEIPLLCIHSASHTVYTHRRTTALYETHTAHRHRSICIHSVLLFVFSFFLFLPITQACILTMFYSHLTKHETDPIIHSLISFHFFILFPFLFLSN